MIKRLLYHQFRLLYSLTQRMRRRLTPAGFFVLAGILASGILGVDTNQTMAYQIFTLLASLLVISIASGLFYRTRLIAHRVLPRYGTVGEPLGYRLVLENHTQKKHIGLYLQDQLTDPHPTLEEFIQTPDPNDKNRNWFDRVVGYPRWLWLISKKRVAISKEQPMASLGPKKKVEVLAEIKPLRRGPLQFTGLTIARSDPFGLVKFLTRDPARQSVLVLPKRYAVPPVSLPGGRRYQPGGVAMASTVGDSDEFVSIRDYRPGDPLRHIHWRSWARAGKPMVKEYHAEFFVRHALILDTFGKASQSDIFEEAVCVAASFACTVQTQESLLDLMFIGSEAYCFTSGRGLAQTDRMLEILSSVSLCQEKPFRALQDLVTERVSILSGCICVLLAWDEERKNFIEGLKALEVPLLVFVITDSQDLPLLDPGPMLDPTDRFHILQVGKIKEGLAAL
jgi:branched-subunit amino acid transport protein